MYYLTTIKDKIRVPPKYFGGDLKQAILKITQEEYEGVIDDNLGVVIAITNVKEVGEGHVVPGDGSAYFETELEVINYKPFLHEAVRGEVTESTEFGVFLRIGPIEGLVHVSQIMDDFINYDAKLPGFVGKKTNKKLTVGDDVLAKVVTISLKGTISNSKIGLTMRQPYLGKSDWAKNLRKIQRNQMMKRERVHKFLVI
jgi:DNA-directed RNA polymerase subunit E'